MPHDENPYRSPQTGREKPLAEGESPAAPSSPDSPPVDQVLLTSYGHAAEANLCQSVLRDHGIDSWLENESATVNLFLSNAVGGVKVFVRSTDLPRATDLLAEARAALLARKNQGPVTFNCEECNAEIAFPSDRRGQVETCPKCHEYVDVPD